MKSLFFKMVFATLCFVLLFQFAQKQKRSVTQQTAITESHGVPVRLIIPSINVDTTIENVGVTKKGEMEVPKNINDAGWFYFGPRPGEIGSSVIAGHFDDTNGNAAIFTNLNKLKTGNRLFIVDNEGKTISFIVRESKTYDPGYVAEVFNASSGSHLNLITCDGSWDGIKKSYTKRLVVFSDLTTNVTNQ